MAEPLVTVVTPSYNQGRFIRDTIESVLGQDYPRIEYVVMDGGSVDETLPILRDYAGRLRWTSAPDRGQASAINQGWRHGGGEILAWLNSDDTYLPGAVRRAVSHLARHPDAGAVYGEAYHTDEAGRVLGRYPTRPFDLRRLTESCFICQPAVFVRRAAAAQAGFLDESLDFCMDYDFWIRIAKLARFDYVPEYLATSRFYAATKTLSRRTEVYAEVLPMIHRHFGHVPPSWVYAYAKAQAGACDLRDSRWARIRFGARLVSVGLQTYRRYNRGLSVAGLLRWRHSWTRAWRVLRRAGVT